MIHRIANLEEIVTILEAESGLSKSKEPHTLIIPTEDRITKLEHYIHFIAKELIQLKKTIR